MRSSALFIVCGVAVLASYGCSPGTKGTNCRRFEVASMGPENAFTATVREGEIPPLDGTADRISLALTIVPPVTGDVRLLQTINDEEVGNWAVQVGGPTGMSSRCSIGLSVRNSTCRVGITETPHPVTGRYTLLANGNHVLEAGLSFYVCD